MRSVRYRLSEFFLIFILAPIILTLPISIYLKLGIGIFGFLYIIFVLLRIEKSRFKLADDLNWSRFWKQVFKHFLIIALITTLYVWIVEPDYLFKVMLKNSKLWVFILFFYSLFSVYPQELIYRTFFFQRYESLFSNKRILIFVNAIVFSLAHIFFKNTLVMVLTFLGGLMFALTFIRTRSTVMVSVEHAIYGCWLFTVGMGDMLGFPS